MSTDSSGISFTAFYTGEVWRRHGLSASFLAQPKGRAMYLASKPFEMTAKFLFGINGEALLLQRHRILDHLLERAVLDEGYTQIVEIACGLSPRGTRMMQRFAGKDIVYLEADLPEMADRKRRLLEGAGMTSDQHRVIRINILETGTADSLEQVFARELDPSRKTIVITEGLINYFDYATIHDFWTRLAAALKPFAAGIYLTDLYPNFQWYPGMKLASAIKQGLSAATRSHVTLHFDNEEEIRLGFSQAGFLTTQVHLPESWYGVLDIPVLRRPSLIRVVEGRI